jgi:hypothetical protein
MVDELTRDLDAVDRVRLEVAELIRDLEGEEEILEGRR